MKVSWCLLGSAAIAFSAGGRILHEFTKTDRVIDESLGVALALCFCLLGAIARYFAMHEHGGDKQVRDTQE